MSTFSKSGQKYVVKQLETPCNVYLCFYEVRNENVKQLFQHVRSLSSSCTSSECNTFTHWAVQVCYDDDTMFLCQAFDEEGKLRGRINPWSRHDERTRKLLKPKELLGRRNIEKGRLMDIVSKLNTGEDYNVVTNNCQHWVKKLLKEMDIDVKNYMSIIDLSLSKLMSSKII